MKKNILMIIPAYNEERNLPHVISDIEKHVDRGVIDIVLINDGSTDRTSEIAKEAGFKIINHPFNLGAGSAVHTGLLYAYEKGYGIAVTFDSDGQHRAEDLAFLLGEFEEKGVDVLIGSRFLSSECYYIPLIRRVGMRFFSFLASYLSGQKITDPSSGYRVYSRRAIELLARMDYPSDYQDADMILFLSRRGMRIMEVPVTMRNRIYGKSMIRNIKAIYYVYKNILSILMVLLREKPQAEYRNI